MKQRNPLAVFFLPFITLGIYSIVWLVKTKGEMNRQGANIPSSWLIIIPFVSIYWMWKYSEGVAQVTNNKLSAAVTLLLVWFTGNVGEAIIQDSFNKIPAVGSSNVNPPFVVPPIDNNPSTLVQ